MRLDSEKLSEEIQKEIEEDEAEKTESESSDYGNTEMDKATQNEDESYIEMNENTEEIQAQPVEIRNRGRSRETTKAVMETRKHMIQKERRQEQGHARRSERIKERITLILDGEIPKSVKKAKGMSD